MVQQWPGAGLGALNVAVPAWDILKEVPLASLPLPYLTSGQITGEGNETHSSVLAWRIPGTRRPGGLPSMGSHRVGHD